MAAGEPESPDQSPPEEAQRRFDALLRAVLTSPPLHLKDVPRKRLEPKRKAGKAAKPSGEHL